MLPIKHIDYRTTKEYYPKNGDILIWESWLPHSVPPNQSNKRETLIFNL